MNDLEPKIVVDLSNFSEADYLALNPDVARAVILFNDYLAKLERPMVEKTYPKFLRNSGGALWLERLQHSRERRDRPTRPVASGRSFLRRWLAK